MAVFVNAFPIEAMLNRVPAAAGVFFSRSASAVGLLEDRLAVLRDRDNAREGVGRGARREIRVERLLQIGLGHRGADRRRRRPGRPVFLIAHFDAQ